MIRIAKLSIVLAVCMAGGPAMADLATGPVMFGSSGERSLQQVLDDITIGGDSSIVTTQDTILDSGDSWWTIGDEGAATIVVEIAGYAGSNRFGLYNKYDKDQFVEVFAGGDRGGTTATITVDGSGRVRIGDDGAWQEMGSSRFGLYLDVPTTGHTYYSDTSLNPDGVDHMRAYQGQNDWIGIGGTALLWDPDSIVFGWDDLYGGGDRDYQDFVVMVQDIYPSAPVPGAAFLGVLGLAAAGCKLRKRT